MGARCLGASGFARVVLGARGGGEMGGLAGFGQIKRISGLAVQRLLVLFWAGNYYGYNCSWVGSVAYVQLLQFEGIRIGLERGGYWV
jgi:hypothetical protein